MQVGSFSDQDSIQSPDGSQQEFSLANMHRKDVGQAVGLTGRSISLSEPLHAVLNHNLEDFATRDFQVEKHLQSVAASNGNQGDSVDQYTGGSGLQAASIGHWNRVDESQGLNWNTKQDHWGQPHEATVVKMAPTRPLLSISFCLLAPLCDHRSLSNLQQRSTEAWYTLNQNDRLVPFLVAVQ